MGRGGGGRGRGRELGEGVARLDEGCREVMVHLIVHVHSQEKYSDEEDEEERVSKTSNYTVSTCIYIQWNLSNPDTLGTEESVLISEVS